MFDVSQIILPVTDMDKAVGFYEALGFPVLMRDGDRYALLQAGPVKIALAGWMQRLPDQGVAIAFKVDSVDDAARQLSGAGAEPPEVEAGPHERTVGVDDPDGHALIFYEPAPK